MARKRREELTLELTPFIDVTFLLIIFFLVTSVFKKDELALALKLPKVEDGKSESSSQLKEITIELSKESIAVNGKVKSIDELKEYIQSLDPKTGVNLRGDGEVNYQRVIKVFELLQAKGFYNISLITEKEND